MAQPSHPAHGINKGTGLGGLMAGDEDDARAVEHAKAPHVHGEMDITVHKRTFEGFIRFWVILFGASAAVLIFLALTNA